MFVRLDCVDINPELVGLECTYIGVMYVHRCDVRT